MSCSAPNKMPAYLITGRAGAGKTTITKELSGRGFKAFDADEVNGLSSWYDTRSETWVDFEDNSYVDLERYLWLWRPSVVRELLQSHETFFLCGGAHNDLDFVAEFTQSFVLDVKPDEQIRRVLQRTDNEYGKDLAMHPALISGQAKHLAQARSVGSFIIDANQPIKAVADSILGIISAR